MKTGFTFGGLGNDYAMTFQFNNSGTRGFWWGDDVHTDAQGAMALTTGGKLTVAHSLRLGYGETDTTTPGATYSLDVSGAVNITGELEVDGLLDLNGNILGDGASTITGIETIIVDSTGDITKSGHGNYLYHKSTAYDDDQEGEITFSTAAASLGSDGDIWFRYTA